MANMAPINWVGNGLSNGFTSGVNYLGGAALDRLNMGAGAMDPMALTNLPHLGVALEEEAPPQVPVEDPLARARKIADAARNPAILGRLVGSFLKSAEETMGMLESAVQAQDGPAVAAAAHRLRGSSGSFGAASLSEAAGKLEDGLERQTLEQCGALIDNVRNLWTPLRDVLVNNSGGTNP